MNQMDPYETVATKQPLGIEAPERIDVRRCDIFPKEMIARHVGRYSWACDIISNRFGTAGNVIDFATGTGYGAEMLASVAKKVYARDRDDGAIKIAISRQSMPNINFRARDRIGLHPCAQCPSAECPCRKPSFDAVVSIETIEHLDPKTGFGPTEFLRACHDLIIPHGLLILSTPQARADGVVDNPWHLREYRPADLMAEVEAAGFTDIKTDPWLTGFIHLTAVRPE